MGRSANRIGAEAGGSRDALSPFSFKALLRQKSTATRLPAQTAAAPKQHALIAAARQGAKAAIRLRSNQASPEPLQAHLEDSNVRLKSHAGHLSQDAEADNLSMG